MSNLKLKKESTIGTFFDVEKPETQLIQDFTALAVELTAAYISKNSVPSSDVPELLKRFSNALMDNLQIINMAVANSPARTPAVPIEESVHDDYLICLEDGKKLQMLKRHLMTVYNMSVDQYRERWGLSSEYPMVAPAYARRRSGIAKSTGLGNGRKKK